MKLFSGQQSNWPTKRMFQAGHSSRFGAVFTGAHTKHHNHSAMFPRVSPYHTPIKSASIDISKLTTSKITSTSSLYNSSNNNNNTLPSLLPKLTRMESTNKPTATQECASVSIFTATNDKNHKESLTSKETITTSTCSSSNSSSNNNSSSSISSTTVGITDSENRRTVTIVGVATSKQSRVGIPQNENDQKGSVDSMSSNMANRRSSSVGEHYFDDTRGATIDQREQERRNRRKFYWYGSHKLIKPIKDIPPRFQLMLAETNAEKARCEGRPIILRQHIELADHFVSNSMTAFNPEAQCLIPSFCYDPSRLCHSDGILDKKEQVALTAAMTSCSNPTTAMTTTGSDLLTDTNGATTSLSLPLSQPPPSMYTFHIYSSSCNMEGAGNAGSAAGGSPSGNANACCLHLPTANTAGYLTGAPQTTIPTHNLQQTPIYFPTQAPSAPPNATTPTSYITAQQAFSSPYPPPTVPPHAFLSTSASLGGNTVGIGAIAAAAAQAFQYPQYTPCVSYTQNAQYTVTAVPQ